MPTHGMWLLGVRMGSFGAPPILILGLPATVTATYVKTTASPKDYN